MGNTLKPPKPPGTVVIVVPHATVPRPFDLAKARDEDLDDIEEMMNTVLTQGSLPLETKIPDLRALAAAIALRRAFMRAGARVVLVGNEVLVKDSDPALRYVGDAAFTDTAVAAVCGAARTQHVRAVVEVHSFATRGLPNDVLLANERPPHNWYCFTKTGRSFARPGCVERAATADHAILHAVADAGVATPYVIFEFFQHLYHYQPESLYRDAADLAAWTLRVFD